MAHEKIHFIIINTIPAMVIKKSGGNEEAKFSGQQKVIN